MVSSSSSHSNKDKDTYSFSNIRSALGSSTHSRSRFYNTCHSRSTMDSSTSSDEGSELQLQDLIDPRYILSHGGTNDSGSSSHNASISNSIRSNSTHNDDLVHRFNESVGSRTLERSVAEFYLEMCDGNVEKSAQFYIEQKIEEERRSRTSSLNNSAHSLNMTAATATTRTTTATATTNNNSSLNTSSSLHTVSSLHRNDSFSNKYASTTRRSASSHGTNSSSHRPTQARTRRQIPKRTRSVEAAEGPVISSPVFARGGTPRRAKSDDANALYRATAERERVHPTNKVAAANNFAPNHIRRGSQLLPSYGHNNNSNKLDPNNPQSVKQAASAMRQRMNRSCSFDYPRKSSPWEISASDGPGQRIRPLGDSSSSHHARQKPFPESTSGLPRPTTRHNLNSIPRRQSSRLSCDVSSTGTASSTVLSSPQSQRRLIVEENELPTDVIVSRPPTAPRS